MQQCLRCETNAVVNDAGVCQSVDLSGVTILQIDRHMSVNFQGPFAITQAVIDEMRLQGKGGSVVSIVSITATMGSSKPTHYASTKVALL
jgi:L-rhamnose 1-dehydrogenase